ncbi:MAG: hypothetical protein ABI644_09850 [Arenimonas sp.]
MKKTLVVFVLSLALLMAGFATSSYAKKISAQDNLVGAWHGKVQFRNGVLAGVKDLEFLYVFNAGGTMTESSNYDASPPVPPAYGIWRKTGPGKYEAKYRFFWTNPPKGFDEIANGGGWPPGGSGILVEKITLSQDRKSFKSSISFDVFDKSGKIIESGSEGEAETERMSF